MSLPLRIGVVSAHYPPNFVSGGTLQPQRLARGLQARGHEVSVYAGWLGERPALTVFDERDEHGLPIHWIVTTPFIGWSDPANVKNQAVRDDFVRFLDRSTPDVVHFHSLQTLGGTLVRAAKEAGASTVLTMHDFWWWCARQFLVDRSFRPCSLVVACGTCACEVDRPWLDRRDELLATMLPYADLVLAPSATAAAVFAANGVDPGRLEVDENGLPESWPTARAGHPGDRPVRFVYTGGHLEMKGVHVLLAAADRLAAQDGFELHAYGAGPYLAGRARSPAGPKLVPHDAFTPDDLDAVLADTDVFVVPSVMRETFSIATREALQRGVPVLCTDSLGPEEVVTDGVNGLVVPAGDAVALAEAMRRLVTDRELLARLTAGAAGPIAERSVEDQVAGLEERYRRLVGSRPGAAGAPVAGAAPPSVRRVLFLSGIDGAPIRYRAHLPAEALELLGVECEVCHYRDQRVPELAERADVVVVYRVPATVQVLELIERTRRRGTPVVFDVDDLIVDPDIAAEIPALQILAPDEAALWLDGVCRYRTTLEHCDGYIGSTPLLVDHIAELTGLPAARFDNGVGLHLARRSDTAAARSRRRGPLRVGYSSGTTTHDHDWAFVLPALQEVMERRPDVELWAGGFLPDTPELARFGRRVRRLPFVPWLDLPQVQRDLDVNLAPLAPGSRFNEAKSAIKWLEAALVATPTVATPTTPFREAIDDGRTGMLASTPEEWVAAILALLDDPLLRADLGSKARRAALLGWSPWLQGRRYLSILHDSFEWRASSRPPLSWEPVAHDEPWMDVSLAPYTDAVPTNPWAARLEALGGRGQLPLRVARRVRSGVRALAARRI